MKRCRCGQDMDITLRTIVHARSIEVLHVPVYTCSSCGHSELMPEIKKDVIEIMKDVYNAEASDRTTIYFEERHELASVLKECLESGGYDSDLVQVIEQVLNERVNHLLDIYLLAKTCGDAAWTEDIERRLKQISCFRSNPFEVKIS